MPLIAGGIAGALAFIVGGMRKGATTMGNLLIGAVAAIAVGLGVKIFTDPDKGTTTPGPGGTTTPAPVVTITPPTAGKKIELSAVSTTDTRFPPVGGASSQYFTMYSGGKDSELTIPGADVIAADKGGKDQYGRRVYFVGHEVTDGGEKKFKITHVQFSDKAGRDTGTKDLVYTVPAGSFPLIKLHEGKIDPNGPGMQPALQKLVGQAVQGIGGVAKLNSVVADQTKAALSAGAGTTPPASLVLASDTVVWGAVDNSQDEILNKSGVRKNEIHSEKTLLRDKIKLSNRAALTKRSDPYSLSTAWVYTSVKDPRTNKVMTGYVAFSGDATVGDGGKITDYKVNKMYFRKLDGSDYVPIPLNKDQQFKLSGAGTNSLDMGSSNRRLIADAVSKTISANYDTLMPHLREAPIALGEQHSAEIQRVSTTPRELELINESLKNEAEIVVTRADGTTQKFKFDLERKAGEKGNFFTVNNITITDENDVYVGKVGYHPPIILSVDGNKISIDPTTTAGSANRGALESAIFNQLNKLAPGVGQNKSRVVGITIDKLERDSAALKRQILKDHAAQKIKVDGIEAKNGKMFIKVIDSNSTPPKNYTLKGHFEGGDKKIFIVEAVANRHVGADAPATSFTPVPATPPQPALDLTAANAGISLKNRVEGLSNLFLSPPEKAAKLGLNSNINKALEQGQLSDKIAMAPPLGGKERMVFFVKGDKLMAARGTLSDDGKTLGKISMTEVKVGLDGKWAVPSAAPSAATKMDAGWKMLAAGKDSVAVTDIAGAVAAAPKKQVDPKLIEALVPAEGGAPKPRERTR